MVRWDAQNESASMPLVLLLKAINVLAVGVDFKLNYYIFFLQLDKKMHKYLQQKKKHNDASLLLTEKQQRIQTFKTTFLCDGRATAR